MSRIVLTDDEGELFVNVPSMPKAAAQSIADTLNKWCSGLATANYWKVVNNDYVLPRQEY